MMHKVTNIDIMSSMTPHSIQWFTDVMTEHDIDDKNMPTFFDTELEWLEEMTSKFEHDLHYRKLAKSDDDEKEHRLGNTMDIVFSHNDLVC